jgi:hypothetical protein
VVADQQLPRHRKLAKQLAQQTVAYLFAMVGKVSRGHAELCVGVMRIDVGDAPRQPLRRIDLVDEVAWPKKMQIGKVNNLHYKGLP